MRLLATIGFVLLCFSQLSAVDYRATHTPKKHYALGYIADPGFPKGVRTFETSPWKNTTIKQEVDLSAINPPDDDQGQVGECTGHGLARVMASAVKTLTGKFSLFSPKFIYYNERVHMGTVTEDSGAMIGDDGIYSIKAQGACLLPLWDMRQDYLQKPSQRAYVDARTHQVIQSYKVNNRKSGEIEKAMSAGFMVVFGITLKDSFEDLDKSNYIYLGKGVVIGGHCMCFFKYSLKTGRVTAQNQWGDSWALHDTFEMPLTIVRSSAVDDCYIIKAIETP